MALGHLVLPGIGSIVAIAVGASLAHTHAGKLEGELDEIWEANKANKTALANLNAAKVEYEAGLNRIYDGAQLLKAAVGRARREVMRFGFLSRFWKLLRRLCGFSYYTLLEQYELRQLEDAVARFFDLLNQPANGT